MSITCAFMSSRPSSKTAKRPHGPPPMISASVLIGSLMRVRGASFASLIWDDRRECVAGAAPSLGLALGRAHHQAFELGGDLDLTGQARIRLHVVAEVEHVLLHR